MTRFPRTVLKRIGKVENLYKLSGERSARRFGKRSRSVCCSAKGSRKEPSSSREGGRASPPRAWDGGNLSSFLHPPRVGEGFPHHGWGRFSPPLLHREEATIRSTCFPGSHAITSFNSRLNSESAPFPTVFPPIVRHAGKGRDPFPGRGGGN